MSNKPNHSLLMRYQLWGGIADPAFVVFWYTKAGSGISALHRLALANRALRVAEVDVFERIEI